MPPGFTYLGILRIILIWTRQYGIQREMLVHMNLKMRMIVMMLLVVVAKILSGCALDNLASDEMDSLEIEKKVEAWILSQEEEKGRESSKNAMSKEPYTSFYEQAYVKATSNQKKELDTIFADKKH
jgi:hypothetical protein